MINYAINNYKLHILVILFLLLSLPAFPQSVASGFPALNITDQGNGETTYSLSLQILALMTALTVLPSLVLGMTSFTRIYNFRVKNSFSDRFFVIFAIPCN